MDKVSMPYLFSFERYKTKYVIKVLIKTIDDVIIFKIYIQSSCKAMADREKKRIMEVKKFESVKNEKRFLDEIKNIFHDF